MPEFCDRLSIILKSGENPSDSKIFTKNTPKRLLFITDFLKTVKKLFTKKSAFRAPEPGIFKTDSILIIDTHRTLSFKTFPQNNSRNRQENYATLNVQL